MTAFRKGRLQGLSCLKGNFHEQFLGGWAGAIPPGYPAAVLHGGECPALCTLVLSGFLHHAGRLWQSVREVWEPRRCLPGG
jgi:hypothetical protein